MTIDYAGLSATEKYYYLQHLIAPRPIALVSTISGSGTVNLSPFSFFNVFSSNPPVLIFSTVRRMRDGTDKHTLLNVIEVPEAVIHIVTHDMVQQASLASCEFGREVNEFTKAGFTPQPATRVKPPMVAESAAKFECKVVEVKSLGSEGGAGQLIICEVLCLHLADHLLSAPGRIDQQALDLAARLGGDWYTRTTPESLFEVAKPNRHLGMGIDALPPSIKKSSILTGNHLGQLANTESLPVVDPSFTDEHLTNIIQYFSLNPADMEKELHLHAARLLDAGKVAGAWQVLLAGEV